MIIDKRNLIIELISIFLVLSYFILKNIILVFVGISFALYCINLIKINKLINSYINSNLNKKDIKLNNFEEESIKNNDIKNKIHTLSLVETIEELGFIPSLDKKDDSSAA